MNTVTAAAVFAGVPHDWGPTKQQVLPALLQPGMLPRLTVPGPQQSCAVSGEGPAWSH
jgi:hypothetical protein